MSLPDSKLNPAIADSADDASPQSALACDDSYLRRLRDRDTDAFDRFVVEQAPRVHRLVSRLLGWDNECDDVVQDVFVVAWEKIHQYRGDSQITTWLYAIAINQCRKRKRRYKKRNAALKDLYEVRTGERESRPQDDHDSPSLAGIHDAINQLSHRDRELIVLCSLEGKTPGEAGTLLGIRKNTLEVRLHRARKRLKQILAGSTDD